MRVWQQLIRKILRKDRMSKQQEEKRPGVVFHVSGDAMNPREVPWGAGLRFPLPVRIEAGKSVRIDYLVSASLPLLLVPMRRLAEYNVEMKGGARIVPAGENVVVEFVNNNRTGDITLETGDTLVSVHPLRWTEGMAIE